MTKQRSLWSLAGRALWLTLGAAFVLAVCIIFGTMVLESFVHSIGENIAETETLRWRTDGQLAIQYRGRNIEKAWSLDRKELEPAKTSANYFSLTNEALWARHEPVMPNQRVEKVQHGDASDFWFFHHRAGRGIYVAANPRTKLISGYLGPRGFQTTKPSADEQFDLSARSGSKRIGVQRQWMRLGGLDWTGSDLNFESNGELLLQDDGRRLYLVDLKQRTASTVHAGEAIQAVAIVKTLTQPMPRLALRFADRVEERNFGAPFEVKHVAKLPASVREWATVEWIPHTGEAPDREIYVRTFRGQHEIVWANSEGTVVQERTLKLLSQSRQFDDAGNVIPIPEFAAWLMGSVQCPVFSTSMFVGDFAISAVASREFDAEVATRAIYGMSTAEVERRGWAIVALPLAMTWLVAAFWSWLGVRRLKTFGTPMRERRFWAAWIALFGLPGYLAMRVHRRWPVLVNCAACSKRTPCNAESCMTCGASGIRFRPHSLCQSSCSPSDRLAVYLTKNGRRTPLAIAARCLEQAEEFGLGLAARLGDAAGVAMLFVKELRLVAGVAALGMAAFVWLVGSTMNLPVFNAFSNHQQSYSPFQLNRELPTFAWLSILLAVSLGYWQTLSEGVNGAWQFLLHRPVSRRTVVLSKLVTGWLLLLGLSAWPIVLMGWWASLPGSYAFPFEWWMTEPFWRMWWLVPVFYLGAFASGLRPARWAGTRLLPLVAIVGLIAVHEVFAVKTWSWWTEAAAVATVMVTISVVILTVGSERDYA